jgi:hypothetical protein
VPHSQLSRHATSHDCPARMNPLLSDGTVDYAALAAAGLDADAFGNVLSSA